MYIHLVYYSGDRSLVESIRKEGVAGITADRTFFLDAVDNDGDALRFLHNNGGHFDVIFLSAEAAHSVYREILEAVRRGIALLETDIRERQTSDIPPETWKTGRTS